MSLSNAHRRRATSIRRCMTLSYSRTGDRARPCATGLLLSVLVLVACDSFTGADCTSELGMNVRPQGEQQLAVGESFTGSISLSTCSGRQRLTDTFVWSGRDTIVVRVEATTNRVTGRSPGSTFVDVRATRYRAIYTIPVVVR